MSEHHDPANENTQSGDVHAQQERLKDAFPGEAGAKPTKSQWADPDMSLMETGFDNAPRLPIEVLGPFWQTWVERSAQAANAPVDYTAGTLLATVGALLGNVRWPNVEGGWEDPSVVWIGLVGRRCAPSPYKRPWHGGLDWKYIVTSFRLPITQSLVTHYNWWNETSNNSVAFG